MTPTDSNSIQTSTHFLSWLLVITLFGFGIRIWHLETPSFDYDEAYEILHVETDLRVLVDRLDGFPPLYRWITGNLFALTGNDQTFRWFSALLGTATILVVGILGKQTLGPKVGLFSALFFAISANHVLVSQLGRGYSLYVFFASLAILFAWQLRKEDSVMNWVLFLLSAWLTVATHYFAGILLLILGGLLIAERSALNQSRVADFKRTISAAILLVIICLPLVYCLKADLGPSNKFHHKVEFDLEAYAFSYFRLASGSTLGPSVTELREMGAGPGIKAMLPWALAIFVPTLILFAAAWKKLGKGDRAWLSLLILAPPPMILLAGQIAPTGYSYRYMAWMIVPWVLSVGCGAAINRQKPWASASTLLLISLSLLAIYNRHCDVRYADQDFHAAVELIQNETSGEEFSPAVLVAPRYFGEAALYALPDDWIGRNITATPNTEQDWNLTLPAFREVVSTRQEAWLVIPWYPQKDPRHAVCKQLIDRLDAKLVCRVTPTMMIYRFTTDAI